eukprot:7673748-Karenia_brevis.AAC.1
MVQGCPILYMVWGMDCQPGKAQEAGRTMWGQGPHGGQNTQSSGQKPNPSIHEMPRVAMSWE